MKTREKDPVNVVMLLKEAIEWTRFIFGVKEGTNLVALPDVGLDKRLYCKIGVETGGKVKS